MKHYAGLDLLWVLSFAEFSIYKINLRNLVTLPAGAIMVRKLLALLKRVKKLP